MKKMLKNIYYLINGIIYPNGVKKSVNGVDCRFYHRFARGIPENIQNLMLDELLKEAKYKKVVFELGGHIGTWTELISNSMPYDAKLVVFEPNPMNFKLLSYQSKVSLSKHKHMLENKAVSDKIGLIDFFVYGNNIFDISDSAKSSLAKGISKASNKNLKKIKVETIDLDSYCQKNKIIPELVKIDIEGAELQALKGMSNLLKHNKIIMYVELHQFLWSEFGYSGIDIINFIKSLDNFEIVLPNGEIINDYIEDWDDNNKVGFAIIRPKQNF